MDAVTGEPAEAALHTLDRRAITLWRVTGLGRVLLLAGAVLAIEILGDLPVPLGMATAAVALPGAALAMIFPRLRYRAWRFALLDDHVHLRYGVLFRTTSIVPYARIQHVDTRHGPLDRWLGLASLVVFTAGTRGAILTVPALQADEAETLRDRLAALSGAGDAV